MQCNEWDEVDNIHVFMANAYPKTAIVCLHTESCVRKISVNEQQMPVSSPSFDAPYKFYLLRG
jgi:hypothetical protein